MLPEYELAVPKVSVVLLLEVAADASVIELPLTIEAIVSPVGMPTPLTSSPTYKPLVEVSPPMVVEPCR